MYCQIVSKFSSVIQNKLFLYETFDEKQTLKYIIQDEYINIQRDVLAVKTFSPKLTSLGFQVTQKNALLL